MNILALESYYNGSHKAFIDGLSGASRHNWTILTLPGHKWKWRMRHSAITFAQQVIEKMKNGLAWDMIFCSDMLNLAEFVALLPTDLAALPKIIYFHENQLTYPVRIEDERDYQFAMTNLTSALAANGVWFNSGFHKNSFLDALQKLLKSMPDYQPYEAIEAIRKKSTVFPPGINDFPATSSRKPGPLKILWAARWEHDKNPEDFFKAIDILKDEGIQFRISVIGQNFRDQPEIFERAKSYFADYIDYWGYQHNREDYERILSCSDVIVSTANHEFFGISVVEAVAAGVFPLVPNRLSYPEIFGLGQIEGAEQFFYDGSVQNLAEKLKMLATSIGKGDIWPDTINPESITERLKWENLADIYDDAIENICLKSI